jgi:hypothetical protein
MMKRNIAQRIGNEHLDPREKWILLFAKRISDHPHLTLSGTVSAFCYSQARLFIISLFAVRACVASTGSSIIDKRMSFDLPGGKGMLRPQNDINSK